MTQEYFNEFIQIIKKLRSETGCPWDRVQTHESLVDCMREEAYEVIDAIHQKDIPNLREELGDVLLQVVMHSVIAEEEQEFTIDDVIKEVSKKMVHRHPHVFGTKTANTAEEVLKNWEDIKKEEHKEKTISDSILKIPKALPATIRAEKVQKKAAKVGFDFENYNQVLEKVYEELEELKEAQKIGKKNQIEEEFGDFMFSVVNLSRFLQLNAENSLTNATDKFINRFVGVECIAQSRGKSLESLSIEELETLWEQIKESEKKDN